MKKVQTFGAEIEKPVSSLKTQLSQGVTQDFFKNISQVAQKRKAHPHYHMSDLKPKVIVGVTSDDLGEQGLDHGFNILETASSVQPSLEALNKLLWTDIKTTQDALLKENATIINFSNHPFATKTLDAYRTFAAPKGAYPYLWSRGWNFTASINANAQNSPATGVAVSDAADAVSAIIGAGAGMIALFGNSPFVEGTVSGFKESRVTMWDTVMKFSKFEGDRITARFPKKRFENLAEYFAWVFGDKTSMHFALADTENAKDYKGIGDRILLSPQNPSVLEFLSKPEWEMYYFKDLEKGFPFQKIEKVKPSIAHLEVLQWAHFAGARIRFGLKNHADFPLEAFVAACKTPKANDVEKIFEEFSTYTYIEGRDPGANFPDKEMWEAGDTIARSVLIAPSAMQKGLLSNLKKTIGYIDSFAWQDLQKLRDVAIQKGLDGKVKNMSVRAFTEKILQLAEDGLPQEEKKYLAYPKWVLEKNQNGADRALSFVKSYKGSEKEAIKALVKERTVLLQ